MLQMFRKIQFLLKFICNEYYMVVYGKYTLRLNP